MPSKLSEIGIAGAIGSVPVVGGMLDGIVNSLVGGEKKKELNNKEIIELAKQYLMVLELRSTKNTILSNKYTELSTKFAAQIEAYSDKGFFKKLF